MKRAFALLALFASVALAQVYPPAVKSSQLTPTGTGVATSGPMTLYVDPTGNDSNSGTGTGTAATKTLQGVVGKVPKNIRHTVIATVACGTYTTGAVVSGFTVDPSAQLDAGFLIQGTLVDAGIASGLQAGLVGSASAGTLAAWGTLTGPNATGWTNADLIGRLVEITLGTGAGQVKAIVANDAGTLMIGGQWETLPTSSSNFEIRDWCSTITGETTVPDGIANGIPSAGSGAIVTSAAAGFAFANNDASLIGGRANKPAIGLSKFRFTSNNSNPKVLIAGQNQFVSLNANRFEASSGLSAVAYNGASYSAQSNVFISASARNTLQCAGTGRSTLNGGAGQVSLYGNYLINTSGNTTISGFRTDGCGFESTQNHWESNGRCFQYGSLTNGLLSGDHFVTCDQAVPELPGPGKEAAAGSTIYVDTVSLSGVGTGFEVYGSSLLEFKGGATTGTSSTTVQAQFGGKAFLIATPTVTASVSDTTIQGSAFSFATITAAEPKAICDLMYGSCIGTNSTSTASPQIINGLLSVAIGVDAGYVAIKGKPVPSMPLLAGQAPHIEICRDAGVTGALTCDFNQAFTQVPVCSCLCIDAVLANACEKTSTSTTNITLKTNSTDVCDVTCTGF